jgi:hypothetical protein
MGGSSLAGLTVRSAHLKARCRYTKSLSQGGFGKVRKATETPFNMVLEARP